MATARLRSRLRYCPIRSISSTCSRALAVAGRGATLLLHPEVRPWAAACDEAADHGAGWSIRQMSLAGTIPNPASAIGERDGPLATIAFASVPEGPTRAVVESSGNAASVSERHASPCAARAIHSSLCPVKKRAPRRRNFSGASRGSCDARCFAPVAGRRPSTARSPTSVDLSRAESTRVRCVEGLQDALPPTSLATITAITR